MEPSIIELKYAQKINFTFYYLMTEQGSEPERISNKSSMSHYEDHMDELLKNGWVRVEYTCEY